MVGNDDGDRFPVTGTGRAIALLGVETATLASRLIERVSAENEVEQSATRAQVQLLRDEVRELREALRAGESAGNT